MTAVMVPLRGIGASTLSVWSVYAELADDFWSGFRPAWSACDHTFCAIGDPLSCVSAAEPGCSAGCAKLRVISRI